MWRIAPGFLLSMTACAVSPGSGCPATYAERYEPRTFLGYACERDCARHKAGYAWAAHGQVADAGSCAALPRSEAEGCRVYVEESLPAAAAGYRWALENELSDACHCDGAGEQFRDGCRAATAVPLLPR